MSSELRASLPSTAGIEDEATRSVLSRLIDVLNVRQGYTGDGEQRYVTVADLRRLGVSVASIAGGTKTSEATSATPESVRNALESLLGTDIRAIQAAIAGSPNYQLLGSPVTALAGKGGQIADIRNIINTKFSAFAQIGNKVQSSLNGVRVTIEQNAQTLVDLDGRANGQYYVKIDNQGYVAGFGLFSTARNGPPVSEFYVRADRFAIGSPGVTRVQNEDGTWPPAPQDEIPFIVFTTPTIIEGKTVQPGVYMSRAFIHDGAIRNAMIGTAAINTLEIAGNAVTVPVVANQGGSMTASTTYQTVVSASVTYDAGAVPSVTYISATMNVLVTDPGGGSTGYIAIVINGTTIVDFGTVAATGAGYAPAVAKAVSSAVMGAGTHTVEIMFRTLTAPPTAWSVQNCTVFCLGAKR